MTGERQGRHVVPGTVAECASRGGRRRGLARYAAAVLAFVVLMALPACRRESPEPQTVRELIAREFKAPEGWSELHQEALRLFSEGRKAESTAMLKDFVERHPDFADGHFSLAGNYEFIAADMKGDPAQAVERNRNLELAVAHYKRFRDLRSDPEDRAQASNLLIILYGPEGLNRMDESVAFARAYTLERPKVPSGYAKLARALRQQGSHDAATAVLTDALTRFPRGQRDTDLSDELVEHVQAAPQLSRAVAEQLIAEALADAERLIADPDMRGVGMMAKSRALRASAERIEQNPERRKALTDESERLAEEGMKTISRRLSS